MKRGDQKKLAKRIGISQSFLCEILAGKSRPAWQTAKSIAAITKTDPVVWMDGTPEQIRSALGGVDDD